LECGRDSYRFSSGTHSLPVLAERRNEFRLRKAEAPAFAKMLRRGEIASALHMRISQFAKEYAIIVKSPNLHIAK
jgi:hypothetical protein